MCACLFCSPFPLFQFPWVMAYLTGGVRTFFISLYSPGGGWLGWKLQWVLQLSAGLYWYLTNLKKTALFPNVFIKGLARKFFIVFLFQSITCIMFQASKISKKTCKVLHDKHKVLLNVLNLLVTYIYEQ